MVILAVITKDILPFASIPTYDITNANIKNKDQYMDHERFAIYLETSLTSHFMFEENEYALKCVSTSKVAYAMEEAISAKRTIDPSMLGLLGGNKDSEKFKKCPGYAIYLGYRLRRRSLTKMTENMEFKFGKKLTLITSLKKLGNQPFSKSDTTTPGGIPVDKANVEGQEKFAKDQINQEIHDKSKDDLVKESDTAQDFEIWRRKMSRDILPGQGTGEYEIEDLEDDEYGTKEPVIDNDIKPLENEVEEEEEESIPVPEEDEVDDEKMLEELENKQLMFKLGTLAENYQFLRARIVDLQNGENKIDSRLLGLESTVEKLKQ